MESALQYRLRRRFFIGCVAVGGPALLYAMLLGTYLHTSQSGWMLNSGVTAYLMVGLVSLGALFPHAIPDAFVGLLSTFFTVLSAMNISLIYVRWRDAEGEPHHHRVLRALVPSAFAILTGFIGAYIYWRGVGRFWTALRVTLFLGNSFRLTTVMLLWILEAEPNTFPPGKMSIESAVIYHLMFLATVGAFLAPACRRYISKVTNGQRVVLSLVEVGKIEAVKTTQPSYRSTSSPSDLSFCTMSYCSTIRADDDVSFPFG